MRAAATAPRYPAGEELKSQTQDSSYYAQSTSPEDPTLRTMQLVDRAISALKAELETRFDAVATRFEGMDKAATLLHDDYVRFPTLLDKAITSLREFIFSEIGKTREVHAERFDKIASTFESRQTAIDAALLAQQRSADDNIKIMRSEIDKLAAVSNERFTRIDTQFIERDKRTDQLSLADKTAVAAALQAAKEAVGAQNTSNSIAIAKSESSTVESIRQLQNLFNSAIDGLNDKVNDLKSRIDRGEGGSNASKEVRKDNRDSIGIIVGGFGVLIAFAAFAVHFIKP